MSHSSTTPYQPLPLHASMEMSTRGSQVRNSGVFGLHLSPAAVESEDESNAREHAIIALVSEPSLPYRRRLFVFIRNVFASYRTISLTLDNTAHYLGALLARAADWFFSKLRIVF